MDAPRDVDAEADDTPSSRTPGGEERGQGAAGWEVTPQARSQEPDVLYLERGVPLRESIMWELQRCGQLRRFPPSPAA